tara:strand:- start:1799 stop:1942 length:144 start_codon:yes stop_codon:yes gene_type:complete
MIIMNIAEWIANLLICGIAVMIWLVAIFFICMLIHMGKEFINKTFYE